MSPKQLVRPVGVFLSEISRPHINRRPLHGIEVPGDQGIDLLSQIDLLRIEERIALNEFVSPMNVCLRSSAAKPLDIMLSFDFQLIQAPGGPGGT
jgi:hypothetical protein